MPEPPQTPLGDRPHKSFATRILLFVFAATFATAAVVTWSSTHATRARLWETIERHYPAAARDAAAAIAASLARARAELAPLATPGAGPDELEHALARSTLFRRLERLEPGGGLRFGAGGGRPLAPGARARLALRAGDGLHRIPPSLDGPALVASVPVAGGGALVGVLREADLRRGLAAELPDPGAAILLIGAERGVALASQPGLEPRARRTAFFSGGSARDGPVRDYVDARGVRMLGAAHPVGDTGWHVVIETPYSRAFAPVISVLWRVLAVDAAVVMIFSLLAYRIARAIARPIAQLAESARHIANGHFDLEVPEPRREDEVGLLARTFNEMMRKLREYQAEIEAANRELTDRNLELQQAKETFEQLSITDGLTRLHNHRFFHETLTREIKRANRTRDPLSMLMLDIDDFKRLNDRFGHAAGDELLSGIARILNDLVRESDLLARYGGEEFVVLASDTDLEGAARLAEKIRMTIADSSFILDDSLRPARITVSVGVAQYAGNRKLFFQAADRALYRAKEEGKNCVVLDDELRVL